MAMQAVQTNTTTGNLTDPRAAYEGMRKLVSETESELGRIHDELDVMTQAWKALSWNDYEFDVDAWHRLMSRTVAQVETLRAHVEAEDFKNYLHPTEAERIEEARKDKVVGTLLRGAKAVFAGKPGADKLAEVVELAMPGEV
ncbi:hypothetical protein NLA06_12660 [Desulfomicrobium sp. ZS1]|uniref:hypothetical protein n=1 Tax=Desulfomicrobium sp. ZS1 TaxID=2952228 RepID=UPI0020B2B7C9|nr:hypothetical protein [Desulfomicrobium sp. ZS1]UTF49408.1 hypothetical protein NLA06_12660 [Desulfomicrobium sp. ZS1]